MADKKPIDLSFPVKGLDENWAYKAQPEGTSPDCLNVRPYDVISQRLRGGSRAGISRYFANPVNGTNSIQRMGVVIKSVLGGATSTTDPFTQGNGQLSSTNWIPFQESGTNFVASATYPIVNSNHILASNTNTPGLITVGALHKTAAISGANFTMSANITLAVAAVDSAIAYFSLVTSYSTGTLPAPVNDADEAFVFMAYNAGVQTLEYGLSGGAFGIETMTPGSGDYLDPAWWTTPRAFVLTSSDSGAHCTLSIGGHTLISGSLGIDPTTRTHSGFEINKSGDTGNAITVDDWYVASGSSISNRKPTIVVVSGGNIYSSTSALSGTTLATGGSGALVSTVERVHMTDSLGKMYFADGSNYKVWDNATNTVSTWTASAPGNLPYQGSDKCRLIASYRGRIVLSGLVDDPQNWFMSAVGDPLNWDYGATVSATMAVAGNNTIAGKCPDIITCLAPMNDDLMVIGGDHTLWLMRGDPADGGRIDNLSQQMGILGPDSWCTDPNGTFYFFGNGVLWSMPRPQPYQKQEPSPMSRGRLDAIFNDIDYSSNTVKLLWDETFHGVHIFIVPSSSGSTYHYWWDMRTDGFWRDQYPGPHGPVSTLIYDADLPGDRVVLLGGWDSVVRQIDATATEDDGTLIESRVKFGPITPGGVHNNCKLNRIITRLGLGSDPVRLRVYAGNSPDSVVLETTPSWATSVTYASPYSMPRITGNTLLFELYNNEPNTRWALEGLSAILDVTGRTRHERL
jgi:hypothetical protein